MKIETMADIRRAVNVDNVENFLIDFGEYMRIWAITRDLLKAGGRVDMDVAINDTSFHWIDDGKHDKKISVKLSYEKD